MLEKYDTLDDRREIWHMLHRIKPMERVKFIEKCCLKVEGPYKGVVFERDKVKDLIAESRYRSDSDVRLTDVIYLDLLMLVAQWRLNFDWVVQTLESVVRRKV